MKWLLPLLAVLGLNACMVTPAVRPTPVSTAVQNEVSFTGDYIDIADVDTSPTPISRARPIYPREFLRAGIGGEAQVVFLVDTEGTPTQVQIERATDAAFGDAARNSVVQWRFTPAMKNDRPVCVRMEVPIVFTVNVN